LDDAPRMELPASYEIGSRVGQPGNRHGVQ